MSEECHTPVNKLLDWGPLTHKQFVTWQAYYTLAMNTPSRSDHYQMQTALHVVRANAKTPQSVKFESFKLQFNSGKPDKEDQARITDYNKEMMAARFGGWDTITVTDENGNVIKEASKKSRASVPPNPMLRRSADTPSDAQSSPPVTRKGYGRAHNPRTGETRNGISG